MKIAIIGSGNVGKALAKSSVKAGHTVTMTATTTQKAAESAKATGAHAANSNQEAVKDADLVIVAVPYDKLGEVLNGISNAEEIQKRHPKVHVVKAFNFSVAARMAEPSVGGTRLDGFVAGDDQAAKDRVLEFVGSIGYRPIDAGPLVMARALESMGLLIVMLQIKHNWPWQNGWKLVGPPQD
jgi:predicted dinucleotide-binding enzyme